MRVHRSVQILTILTTLVACSSPGGTSSGQPDSAPPAAAPAPEPTPSASISVRWDSGPLDQAYRRERTDMDARHTREIATPRANESSNQRAQRQATEKQTLDHRYEKGKASHSRTLPAPER